ncbi:MAG: hypothetical protein ACI86X_000667 [Moritella sp.]|jgi:hypothetical protein
MAYKTAIIAVLALGGASYMTYKATLPLGVKNNNPLNIEYSPRNDWDGQLSNKGERFARFKHPAYGFRAAAKVLRSYSRQGYSTLAQMINRFAPGHENDTGLYISNVSDWTGIASNQVVDVNDDAELAAVIHAMSRMEVGQYYGLKMARKGVSMA